MKAIKLSLFALLIFTSIVYSQAVNYISVEEYTSRIDAGVKSDFWHSRVKYDPWGNVRIITYDGKRFYEQIYKDGYISSYKPIAKGLLNNPNIPNYSGAHFYDFDIDTAGVVHIAFTYFNYNNVYMFYTNSQTDSVFYIGVTSFPFGGIYSPYYHNVNVLRTTDNKIVINYLHYSEPGSTSAASILIKWTQLVNPSANNLQPSSREVYLPVSYPSKSFSAHANKNLFVNLYQYDAFSYYPYDTLYIKYHLLKYDITNPANDAIARIDSGFIIKGSGITMSLPIYTVDYNDGNVLISSIEVSYPGPSNSIVTTSPLDNSIFTLDRQNNLHSLKFSGNQVIYSKNISSSHAINTSYFYPANVGINTSGILQNASIAALNFNNAVMLFNYGGYLVHQFEGNFIYKLLFYRSTFIPYPLKELNFVSKDNKNYLFNATRNYGNLSDSVIIIPLYETREKNNEFCSDLDSSSIINIHIQDVPNFKYPFAKVDKSNQIHLLLFKFLKYGPASSQLGQWYYYKVTNDLQVQGGDRVVAESDTLYILSDIDFDIDGNGVVHVVYFRYIGNGKVMVYTNNSSGTFATPIVIPDTLISSSVWFRVKATRDGKVYIVYYDYNVNVIYGDLNGFSTPKRLFVHPTVDRGGGRNKLSFEVDYQGNLHLFDMSDYPILLRYPYKVIRDSVIFVNRNYTDLSGLNGPQFVTTTQDKDWNIYVLGVTDNEKIYYIHSFDNFQSVRTYDLANYGIFNLLTSGDVFWDYFKPFAVSEKGRVYFHLGEAGSWSLLGWIPILPTDVEKDGSLIPDNFALYQNYPNPFNSKTRIKYTVKEKSHVVLKLFNILGEEVETLKDEFQMPGEYIIELDANKLGLSSGIYFYQLNAENFKAVKKVILLK